MEKTLQIKLKKDKRENETKESRTFLYSFYKHIRTSLKEIRKQMKKLREEQRVWDNG